MRLFLDTEFNGFDGELISMALVSEDGREWYQTFFKAYVDDPWVEKHVTPYLRSLVTETTFPERMSSDDDELLASFETFLAGFWGDAGPEIIADWPADFEHFANLLSELGRNGGFKEAFPCTMRLINAPGQLEPEVPHNALSDARALRDWYLSEARAA